MRNKVYETAARAVADIPDGATILCGGFAGAGTAYGLLTALNATGARRLTCVSNHCGDKEEGLGALIRAGQVGKMIASFPRHPDAYHFQAAYDAGQIELELVPQGTLAERIRAGGAGIGGFYVRTAAGTALAEGKETHLRDGERWVLERPIRADYALVRAAKADPEGNLLFRHAQRNFNPVMAMAARVTIAEVDEIVGTGDLDPEMVVTPGIFVQRVVKADRPPHNPLLRLVRSEQGSDVEAVPSRGLTRQQIAHRVALAIPDGSYVNLGIGIPTLVGGQLPPGRTVTVHSENGILGVGSFASSADARPELLNASRQAITLEPGGSFFHHADSFAMVRGGHIDLAIMGAFQVSAEGDLANWTLPGQAMGSVGGAMDLAVGARTTWVMMEHVARDGSPKILKRCTYPLTGMQCVSRIFTDAALIDVTPEGLVLREIAPGYTVPEVCVMTGAPLIIASDLRVMAI